MKLLLDTHTFIWSIKDDKRLSDTARHALADPDHDPFLSIASVWEMSIKIRLAKLEFELPLDESLERAGRSFNLDLLPIRPEHALRVATLPLHHRDPFDRLIAAQALLENLPLVGRDPAFDAYGVERIW